MRGSPESLAALRLLLAERFSQAAPRPAAILPTGVAAIDEAGDGGLPVGGITEVVALAPSSGGQLLIARLLAATRARRMRAALVDALDAFDPSSHEPSLLQHLVWVRCRTLDEAMHAADLLVRDANLGLVMVDLRGVAVRALHGVPATTWYRLQRALERTAMAMVVFTAEHRETGKSGNRETGQLGNRETAGEIENRPSEIENDQPAPCGLVGSARLRFTLAGSFQLDALAGEQTRLAFALPAGVQRRRHEPDRCSRESESRGPRAAHGSWPGADRARPGAASSDSALVPRHSSLDRILPDAERRSA
jgi:hypothetical protein